MPPVETIDQFYKRTNQIIPSELLNATGNPSHFNVKERSYFSKVSPYNRRDYYKICLTIGTGILHVDNKTIEVNQPALVFSNPNVPYSWESISKKQDGYYCLFNDAFISNELKQGLELLCPLFNAELEPIYFLNNQQTERLKGYFAQLQIELKSDYEYKFDVIRTILRLIIHEGVKLKSETVSIEHKDSAGRIAPMFLDLLERQFPVDSPENPLRVKSASDFADQLNIHVNHLNAVIKSSTGKTTTQVISQRIISEAKTLLKNTEWDVAEIGYCLGFEYPAHFNNYFKKVTGVTPALFKNTI